MEIVLYTTLDKPNKLEKTLQNALTITGNFRSEINDIDVVVEIEKPLQSFNYVEIPALNKYYFVRNVDEINARICRLLLHCDVLMTHKLDILNSYGLLSQGNNTDMYYPTIPHTCKQTVRVLNFVSPFNPNGVFVLTTIKGV